MSEPQTPAEKAQPDWAKVIAVTVMLASGAVASISPFGMPLGILTWLIGVWLLPRAWSGTTWGEWWGSGKRTRPGPLGLVVIRASDPERSVLFYEALGLGFAIEQHGAGPVHFAAEAGGTVFELYPPGKGEVTRGLHLGIRVRSLDDTVASLRRLEAEIVTEPTPGQNGRRAVVADPDGNRVEITPL